MLISNLNCLLLKIIFPIIILDLVLHTCQHSWKWKSELGCRLHPGLSHSVLQWHTEHHRSNPIYDFIVLNFIYYSYSVIFYIKTNNPWKGLCAFAIQCCNFFLLALNFPFSIAVGSWLVPHACILMVWFSAVLLNKRAIDDASCFIKICVVLKNLWLQGKRRIVKINLFLPKAKTCSCKIALNYF